MFNMKKILLFLFLFFIFNLKVNASYVVFDQENFDVLQGENIHEKNLIASITKIMTAHIVINNIKNLNDYIVVGDEVTKTYGSSIYLKKGERIKVIDLLYGLILRSGNDAALELALYTAGSVDSFVNLMNDEVNKWGLKDTIFQNPTGLDDGDTYNISSAYDMAYITSKAMQNKLFRKIFKTKNYHVTTNLNEHIWSNKNKTLYMSKYITGGKTGYTKKAGRTLVSTSSKDGVNIVVVTLDFSDDFNFHVKSHNNIFKNYNRYLILNKTKLNINDNYYNKNGVKFYLKNNYHLLSRRETIKNVRIEYELYKLKKFTDNSIVGKVKVLNNSKEIYNTPIYIKRIKRRF